MEISPYAPRVEDSSKGETGGLNVRAGGHSWTRSARRKHAQEQAAEGTMSVDRPSSSAVSSSVVGFRGGGGREEAEDYFLSTLFLLHSPPPLHPGLPSPPPTLSAHLISLPPNISSEEVAKRRLAWDGLWLYGLRKLREALERPLEEGQGMS